LEDSNDFHFKNLVLSYLENDGATGTGPVLRDLISIIHLSNQKRDFGQNKSSG
jgi:hypothetical protein